MATAPTIREIHGATLRQDADCQRGKSLYLLATRPAMQGSFPRFEVNRFTWLFGWFGSRLHVTRKRTRDERTHTRVHTYAYTRTHVTRTPPRAYAGGMEESRCYGGTQLASL